MSAQHQPSLDAPDLRQRSSWQTLDEHVVGSWCGRYTIVRNPAAPMQRESYSAFRRHGPPDETRWSPPQPLGCYWTPEAAREACALHAEQEPKR